MSVIALKTVIDHFRTVTGDPFKLSFGGVDMFTNTDVLETMEYNFYEYRIFRRDTPTIITHLRMPGISMSKRISKAC